MGISFRRRISLSPRTWLNLSTRGVSVSHRRGRVTVNSRGSVWVRLLRGLTYRGKI